MQMWKTVAVLTVVGALFGVSSSEAITGLGFGVHGGMGNYKGNVFKYTLDFGGVTETVESGDVGSSVQFGGHIKVGTLPFIDFYLNVDYFSKDDFYVYEYFIPGNSKPVYSQSIDFNDLYVSVDGKFNIYAPPLSPVSVYMGGGIGSHLLNTEIAVNITDETEAPEDFETAVEFFEDNGRFDIHGLAGVKINPPVIPLEFFLEGRFALIKTKDEDKGRADDLQTLSIIVGATFNLP